MLWDLQGRYPVSTVTGPKEGCREVNTGLHFLLILLARKVLPIQVSQGWELEAKGAAILEFIAQGKQVKMALDEAEQQWAGFTTKVLHGLMGKMRMGRWRDSWLSRGDGSVGRALRAQA